MTKFAVIALTAALFSPPVFAEKTGTEAKPDPVAEMPPKGMVPDGLIQLGQGQYFSDHAFVADKSRRTLTIWRRSGENLELVEAHPMDKGKKDGDKMVLGDHKTPEGIYFFQEIYEGKNLNFDEYGSRAITMDYPNFYDKREKKTGSGIWLHGIPDTKTLYRGSRGCLVVRNEIIKVISKYVDLKKTPILVFQEVNYVKPKKLASDRKGLNDWLNNWRHSWETKDIEKYMGFYDNSFRALGMNKERWRTYKTRLNEKYSFIDVKINRPIILRFGQEVVIRFLQDYQSDTLKDFGEKRLFVKDAQIVGEEWSAAKSSDELLAKKTD